MDVSDNVGQGYLFAETPLSLETSSKVAFNLNPKIAWSGVGTLWGLGASANVEIASRLELIPEVNFIFSNYTQSNGTIALRWHTSESVAVEVYGSTASSTVDIGQLLNANQIRLGLTLTVRF